MTSDPIWQWSAVAIAEAVREQKVACEAVVSAHVEQMRAVNAGLNAVVADLGDEAMMRAREADAAIARGESLAPLHGVPVTIKENVDFAGHANTMGVPKMANAVAEQNSPVVANLLGAGAIPIGMTNTPEFAMRAFTDNPLHGLTLNPWNAEITCGGSSGGAAASLAAGIGAIAHGNDIGGSLRWPAHFNGVATIRPTLGRVPAFNPSAGGERPIGAQLFSVQGPLARSVADLRLALEVMARRDARDPNWVPAPLFAGQAPVRRRVALAKVPDDMNADPGVMAVVRAAAERLATAGYEVEEVEMPDLTECWQAWSDLLIDELRTLQKDVFWPVTSADFHAVFEAYEAFARPLDKAGYMRALAARTGHLRKWLRLLEAYPVILTPLFAQKAPGPRADLDGAATVREIFMNGGRFVGVVNYLGLPAAVVPAGFCDGNPVGVQLVASRFREDVALDAAEVIEREVGIIARRLWARMAEVGR